MCGVCESGVESAALGTVPKTRITARVKRVMKDALGSVSDLY